MQPFSVLRLLPLVLAAGVSLSARAATLFSENFDGLTLGPYTSPTESGGDGTDWTATAPTGWVKDQTTTPVGGPPEWFGFTFHDKQSWITTEGDQNRSAWAGGSGTVMVADPDAYDDGNIDIAGQLYHVRITTPAISLAGVNAGSVVLGFDSSFRVEGAQTALVDVTFDGVNFTNLLTYNSTLLVDGDTINTLQALPVNNPGAGSMWFRFSLVNAENNWWFAVDNINVTGTVVPEATTGAMFLAALGLVTARRRRS